MAKTIGTTGLTRQDLNVLVAEEDGINEIEVIEGCDSISIGNELWHIVDYCHKPHDAWPTIEKIWDEIMHNIEVDGFVTTRWDETVIKHTCTKLEAAMLIYVGRD